MSNHPPAYAVPFWIDRRLAPQLHHVVNVGDETVRGLRVSLLGSGHLVPMSTVSLGPGSSFTLATLATDSQDSVMVLRWFRPNGEEYLWRFSF
ncbi:MAG: hypothetical protein JWP75_2515 [Frondihabitans sp.]|nr:hypothetical protein [Frondihabitans sp.]